MRADPIDPAPPPLRNELRWFVRLRWMAGLAILAGGAITFLQADQSTVGVQLMAVGAVVLMYNALLWLNDRGLKGAAPAQWLIGVGAVQILLDLACLALMSIWTGGVRSPLIGLFVLHMVAASLLLPPKLAYGAMIAGVLMEFGALAITDLWPRESLDVQLAVAWSLLMVLTVFVANHITSNLRAQQDLAEMESERRRAILTTAADGIITVGESGIVLDVNPAAERIFGYERSEMVGQSVNTLMPSAGDEQHEAFVANSPSTDHSKVLGFGREVTGRRRNGEMFPVELAVSEVKFGDERWFTGILRDITDRKKDEAERKRLYDELQRQQQAMIQHEKMAAIGQMAAGVAHEISNPLASIDSVLQLVRRKPDRLGEKLMGQIEQQVKRITRILRQLTEFAHPLELGWATVRLNDLVTDALDLLHFDHRLRKVDVTLHFSPEAEDVHLVPQAIQQVLVNLISNAIDALEDVENPRLHISTRRTGDECCIEIADTGAGIAEEDLPRLFEPFFTTKPVGRGTGLGLAISYNLVQNHGGRIEVESVPGRGATFTVIVPASCGREATGESIPDSENIDG